MRILGRSLNKSSKGYFDADPYTSVTKEMVTDLARCLGKTHDEILNPGQKKEDRNKVLWYLIKKLDHPAIFVCRYFGISPDVVNRVLEKKAYHLETPINAPLGFKIKYGFRYVSRHDLLTEAGLRAECKAVLGQYGFRVWKNQVIPYKGRKSSVENFIPDLIGYHTITGTFVGCEIKTINDRLSDGQKEELQQIHNSEGIAICAYHPLDVIYKLSEYSNFKNQFYQL